MVFLSGKGEGTFLATTKFDCFPKTYRFLTLFFLEWTKGHGGKCLCIFLSLYLSLVHPGEIPT